MTAVFEYVSLAAPGHRPGGGRPGAEGAKLSTRFPDPRDEHRAQRLQDTCQISQQPRMIRSEAEFGLAMNPFAGDSLAGVDIAPGPLSSLYSTDLGEHGIRVGPQSGGVGSGDTRRQATGAVRGYRDR